MSSCRTTCQGSERWVRSGEIYLDDVNDLGHEGIIHGFMHVDSLVIPHVQHNVIESAAEYTDLDRTAALARIEESTCLSFSIAFCGILMNLTVYNLLRRVIQVCIGADIRRILPTELRQRRTLLSIQKSVRSSRRHPPLARHP